MSFKNKPTAEDVETALDMLLEMLNAEPEDMKTWDEHKEAVEAASAPAEEPTDLDTVSLVDKLGMILHAVSNNILAGNIALENGEETLALTKAVVLREQLREAVKAK